MPPRPDRLEIFYGTDRVGAVHDSAPLAFEYTPGWLGGAQRMSLAAIPLLAGRQATPEVQAFFENLQPEGELRDYLAVSRGCPRARRRPRTSSNPTSGAWPRPGTPQRTRPS